MKQSQKSQQSQQSQPPQQGAKQSGQSSGTPQAKSKSGSSAPVIGSPAKATAVQPHAQPTGSAADSRKTEIDKKGLGQKLKDTLGGVYDKTQKAATAGPQGQQQPGEQQVGTLQSVCDFYKLALKKHYGKTGEEFVNLLLGHSYLIAADMTLLNKIDWLSAGTFEAKCALLELVYGSEWEGNYKATGEITGKVNSKKFGLKTIEKGLGTSLNPLEVGEYLAVTAIAEEMYKCQNLTDFQDQCLFNLDALKKMDSKMTPEQILGAQAQQKGGAPAEGGGGCYYKSAFMGSPFGFCSASNVSVPSDEKMENPMGGTASVAEGVIISGAAGGDKGCGGVVDCEEGSEGTPLPSEISMAPGNSVICPINEMAMGGGLTNEEPATPTEPTPEPEEPEEPSEPEEPKEPEAKKPDKPKEKCDHACVEGEPPAPPPPPPPTENPVPANPSTDPACIPCSGVSSSDPHVDNKTPPEGADAGYVVDAPTPSGGTYPVEIPLHAKGDGKLYADGDGKTLYDKIKDNWEKWGDKVKEKKGGGGGSGYDVASDSNAGPCDKFMQKMQNGLDLMCATLAKEDPMVKSNEDGTPWGFGGTQDQAKGAKGEACNGLVIGKAPIDMIEGGPGAYCCDVSKAGFLWKTAPGLGVTDPTPQDQMGGMGEPAASGADSGAAQDDGASQQQLPADQSGAGEPGTEGPPPGDPGNPGTP